MLEPRATRAGTTESSFATSSDHASKLAMTFSFCWRVEPLDHWDGWVRVQRSVACLLAVEIRLAGRNLARSRSTMAAGGKNDPVQAWHPSHRAAAPRLDLDPRRDS